LSPEASPGQAPAELIRHKRDGGILSAREIGALVAGIADGSMSDGQVAAFAMAVYFRGLTRAECAGLTRAMTRSGTVLDWSRADLGGPNQTYLYFLVSQDGDYLIRHRTGNDVSDVKPGTTHAVVRRPDASGRSVNDLEVRVAGNTISYVVNGMVVHSGPKGSTTTDGVTGVRINHVLNVHVEGFAVGK
jgi:hypothetical protein